MYKGRGFLIIALSIMMFLSVGCVKKTVNSNTALDYTNEDKVTTPVKIDQHDEARTMSTDLPDTPPVDQKTMGDLKAGFKYVKASYTAILAGVDKIKAYDLGDYNIIIERVYPFLVQLGQAIDTYSDALSNTDDAKALTTYNVARSLITTILKVGGPLLLKMIF